MKKYLFTYEDRQRNDLKREVREYNNITDARNAAKYVLSTTSLNDLFRIRVIKQN